MKVKKIIPMLAVLLIPALVYAQSKNNYLGPTVLHRENVTTNDLGIPHTAESSGSYPGSPHFYGYSHVRVWCESNRESTSNYFHIMPYVWDGVAGKYFQHESSGRFIKYDQVFTIETDQSEYVFIKVDGEVGTDTLNIYLQGANRL